MKELSIEQKAKAYDEALKKLRTMRDAWNNLETDYSPKDVVRDIEYYFPELADRENERIRTFLHHTFTAQYLCKDKLGKWHGEPVVNILAWLEKQVEQKPINIVTILDDYFANTPKEQQEKDWEELKYLNNFGWELVEQKSAEISNICEFDIKTWIKIVDYVLTEHNGIGNYLIDPEVKDTAEKLQKKYKFDAASEEWDRVYRKGLDAGVNKGRAEALREQKHADLGENRSRELSLSLQIQAYLNTASDELYAKEKPLYSEERLEDIHKCMLMWQKLHNAYFYQKPAEWSEEDEEMIENIIDTINMSIEDCDVDDVGTKARFTLEKERDWLKNKLKSLRPQSTWRPSEEMLDTLYRVIPENTMEISEDEMLLDKLYQGLKYGKVLSEK